MRETAILSARGWSGSGPWYQTLAFKESVINGIVNVVQGASEKQKQAFSNGSIEVSTISGWLVTFKATGNKPIVNIPIDLTYSETGLESLNSVVIVGTKTSATTFTGTATKEAFGKLKEGNVPLIVSILDSATKKTYMSIKLPSYTYDISGDTISAMAPVIPAVGGSLSFWGMLIKGSDLSVSGFVSAGGGGGGGPVYWGQLLGTLADQLDLSSALGGKVSKISVPVTNNKVYIHTSEGVDSSMDVASQMDSNGLVSGNLVKNYVDTQDDQFVMKTSIVNDLTTGGEAKVASAETVKTLQVNKSKVSASATGTATTTVLYITIDGTEYKLAAGGSAEWGDIVGNILAQTDLMTKLNEKINTTNIKTAWGATPGDGNVPSEKLAYDTFTAKQDKDNLVVSLSASSDNTHYPGAKAVYDFVLEYAADYKGSVATKADLATITGMNINDWAIVLADETQGGRTCRYGYNGSAWSLQWKVKDTTFTSAEWDAIRSGITSAKVLVYDGYAELIAGKLDKNSSIVGATKCKITFDAKGLVTGGADLEESDLPAISISKVTDLQTTLNAKQNVSTLESDVSAKGFTKNVGTLTGIKMNGEVKGSSGVVDLGVVITDVSDKQDTSERVSTISSASTDLQYPTAHSVWSLVTEYAGNFKGSVATKADLTSITGMTVHDWAIVLADETQGGKTCRYGYDGSAWLLQWAINNMSFTAAQLEAINSAITAAKVTQYDGYATGKQNKVLYGTDTPTSTLGEDGDIYIQYLD